MLLMLLTNIYEFLTEFWSVLKLITYLITQRKGHWNWLYWEGSEILGKLNCLKQSNKRSSIAKSFLFNAIQQLYEFEQLLYVMWWASIGLLLNLTVSGKWSFCIRKRKTLIQQLAMTQSTDEWIVHQLASWIVHQLASWIVHQLASWIVHDLASSI